MPLTISIDRGGTFTDVFASINGHEVVFKLLSVDPANYADAPTEGIRRVLEIARKTSIPKNTPLDIGDVESIRMGTTVATNGLLERKGDRVALLVTRGFGDILQLGQQARPDIFDLKVAKLGQLYERVVEVDERVVLDTEAVAGMGQETEQVYAASPPAVGASGEALRVVRAPDLAAVRAALQNVWASGIRSLAIAFLHSYIFPEHELAIAAVAREIGFENVSVSAELQPMIKLVSRANSATADAYLSPIMNRYLHTIARGFVGGLDALGSKLLFMQSDGGLASAQKFTGLKAILSGPAGGVVGYARTSYEGDKPVLGFDMGGTSTDVSRFGGKFEHVFETTTAEVVIQAPQLAIDTVAAGGGSILNWRNGLYAVGPESAGAHPGPACYRKGGPLTVTDANLFLGRIDILSFPHIFGPNENEGLDLDIVRAKFAELARVIAADTGAQTTPETVAQGFLDVANETMCRPIRSLTEGKGHSTTNHVLASFGGAGGQHAAAVARKLGISEVIIHQYSSLLSAYGIALADVVADVQQPVSVDLSAESIPALERRVDEVSHAAVQDLQAQGVAGGSNIEIERFLNCRYQGSDSFMMIRQRPGAGHQQVADDFVAQHRQEFGFSLERPILVGDVRARALYKTELNQESLLRDRSSAVVAPPKPQRTQKMFFGEWVDAALYKLADLPPGCEVSGPAMILDATQTLVVEPFSRAHIHRAHVSLFLDKDTSSTAASGMEADGVDSIQLSVFAHRFMSIAEQMGHTLQKTSISVNIKERLDFSCAIFDPNGGLVANAPHIPVHLGSMSSAVAYQRQYWEGRLEPGDVLVANHPAYGGSHLPDITVITPVFGPDSREIIFWAASRGHHSDIGGITAGSMPPFSHYLWQEGACIQAFKVVSRGNFDQDGIVKLLHEDPAQYPGCSGSRSLGDSLSDMKAQIAANNKGIQLLHALAGEFSLPIVQKYMVAIQDNAEATVRQMLRGFAERVGAPYKVRSMDHLDDGSPLALEVRIDPDTGSAEFDFSGTGLQLFGNLNAPRAITYSAILYALRTMISQDIPLNQGCLSPLSIKIPEGSFLAPGPDAATVGGNVETSQRVTDVLFQCFEAVADSQGTCNNLTFGCELFGYYETIGGGAGAGPGFDGQSAVQVHMTNTRSTDPEVFEKRYPVVLHTFGLRPGSGGSGQWRGGDGIVRDIEFRRPVQLSIMSERRSFAPHGLHGGGAGARGENLWVPRGGAPRSIGGKNTLQLGTGDRVVIKTPGGGGCGEVQK